MKVCPRCGVSQSDKRTECVECGARLEEPVSERVEQRLLEQQEERLEKLYHKGDPLHVSLFDKIMGGIMLAGLLAIPVTLIVCRAWLRANIVTLATALFWLMGVIEAFFPKLGWELEKLRMSFSAVGTEDLTPSHFYFVMRKIALVLFLLLGVFCYCGMIWEGLHPAPAAAPVVVIR